MLFNRGDERRDKDDEFLTFCLNIVLFESFELFSLVLTTFCIEIQLALVDDLAYEIVVVEIVVDGDLEITAAELGATDILMDSFIELLSLTVSKGLFNDSVVNGDFEITATGAIGATDTFFDTDSLKIS